MIPYAALQQLYEDNADLFIEKINATMMTLYFKPVELIPNGGSAAEPSINTLLGGKTSVEYLEDRGGSSGTNLHNKPTTVQLRVRAYWNHKSIDPKFMVDNVGKPRNACKIISYTSDLQTLRNAEYAIIDGNKCVCVDFGVPHGMFGNKRYVSSTWAVV